MRIVHIMISCFYIEGAGYQENLLPREHKREGHDVTIISSQYCFNSKYQHMSRPAGEYLNKDGIKVIILKDNKKLPSILGTYQRKCQGLYEALLNEAPDIIFMHGLSEKDGIDAAKYVAKHRATRLYCDHHSDYYNGANLKRGLLNRLHFNLLIKPTTKYISKYCTKFWGTTPWRVQHLIEMYGLPNEKVELLVMGADDTKINWDNRIQIRNRIRAEHNINENDFLIITGGKINIEKNIHLLAQAVSELERDRIKLLIFGQPDNATKPLLDIFCNHPRIVQIGWVNSDSVYDLFLSSDLGYFPGTHSVLWEQAVACGLPTVFRLWHGMTHVNVNGNAILQESISVNAIKEQITRIVSNPLLFKQMKTNAIKAKDRFFYSEIAKKAIEINDVNTDSL